MAEARSISLVVEGYLDEVVLRRLCSIAGLGVAAVYGMRGKGHALSRLGNYLRAAHYSAWCVLLDLDDSVECAPAWLRALSPTPLLPPMFELRVAVHAVEAWLLADAERMVAYFGIPLARIPRDPEQELDPKRTLVDLARHSRRGWVRSELAPTRASTARVGTGYTAAMAAFVSDEKHGWRPAVALEHADSLRRCLAALEALAQAR